MPLLSSRPILHILYSVLCPERLTSLDCFSQAPCPLAEFDQKEASWLGIRGRLLLTYPGLHVPTGKMGVITVPVSEF